MCLLFLNYHFSLLKEYLIIEEKFANIDDGVKTRKNGKCPLFNKIMCLIIITRNGAAEAKRLGVLGAFSSVIFMAALPGGLGNNAETPLQTQ